MSNILSGEKPLKNRITGKNINKKIVICEDDKFVGLKCYYNRVCNIDKVNETIIFRCFVEYTNSISKAIRSYLHHAGWYEVENVSKEQLRRVIRGQWIKRADFKKMIEWHL